MPLSRKLVLELMGLPLVGRLQDLLLVGRLLSGRPAMPGLGVVLVDEEVHVLSASFACDTQASVSVELAFPMLTYMSFMNPCR
jgi:hypothetical protein